MTCKPAIVLAVALAVTLAILVPGVTRAHAAHTTHATACDNSLHYLGYLFLPLPDVGTTEGVYLTLNSQNRSSGNFRGKIEDGNSLGDDLQVGILNNGSGPEAYIEYDGSFKGTWPVSLGQSVHIWITHDSPADFTAHVGGHGSYQGVVHSSGTYKPYMYVYSTSVSSSGTCNQYDFDFNNLGPWTTGVGEPLYDNIYNGPIVIADDHFRTYLNN